MFIFQFGSLSLAHWLSFLLSLAVSFSLEFFVGTWRATVLATSGARLSRIETGRGVRRSVWFEVWCVVCVSGSPLSAKRAWLGLVGLNTQTTHKVVRPRNPQPNPRQCRQTAAYVVNNAINNREKVAAFLRVSLPHWPLIASEAKP